MKKLGNARKTMIAATFLAVCFSCAALAEEMDAGTWVEQTCALLKEADWLPNACTIEEYTGEYDPLISKYTVRSDEGFFNLTTQKDGRPERFAFQMKAEEPLKTQISTILKAVFPNGEGAEDFAEELADAYDASVEHRKNVKPYAMKLYNEKRCELDMGWLYIWANLPERGTK
ncbi:MAG: hypothetical protein V8Q79_09030 [Christensenellales bacterium]